MIKSLKLPLTFNPQALRKDLERIAADSWIAHFVKVNYSGDWSGIALRGPADAVHPVQSLFANPGTKEWADTDVLQTSPNFRDVLAAFKCPLLSVRLLRLAPGSVIKEHRDHSLGLEDGEVRLHVPVQTNPAVEFYLDGERVPLREGETWYLNVNLPHRVTNNSSQYRVHIVADCVVNDWLRRLFESSANDS